MYVFQVLQYARLCPMFSYRLNLCNVQNFEIYLTNKKYYPWPALLPEWQYFPLSYASEHQKLGWFRETHFTITSSQPSNLGLLSFTSQTNWLSPQRKVFILLGRDFDLQLRGSFALSMDYILTPRIRDSCCCSYSVTENWANTLSNGHTVTVLPLHGSHGLSARRAQRTKSGRPEVLNF